MKSRVTSVSLAVALVAVTLWLTASQVAGRSLHSNVVVDWNQTMLATFAAANVPAPPANRLGGIVQSAVFDAVNGIEPRYTAIHVQPAGPEGASREAATVSAAYTALIGLFPAQKPTLDAAFGVSIASLSEENRESRSIALGLTWGRTVAEQILAWRATDGFSSQPPPYQFKNSAGQWQVTPGGMGAPKFRTLATTTPFALTSPSQFRPTGPPALTTDRYTASFNEIKALGGAVSSVRTPYQTETAAFWQGDGPTASWDRVTDSLALTHHLSVLSSAHLLALVNLSIADATFAIWDAKNFYNFWRPVTAIVHADLTGNPNTAADPAWLPLMITPYFQEYPSAHSGVSSAAATILAAAFGDDTDFTVTSAGLPGVQRSFDSFATAVAQVADARVFAGFHFRFSCDDGIVLGHNVASYVRATLIRPIREEE